MVVLTQPKHPGHSGVVGLHIGSDNVQEHFPREMAMVELELDHLNIVCTLEPSFWQDRPEIHDMRLSLWLESKRSSGKLTGKSAPVALIPCGGQRFRLQLVAEPEKTLATNITPSPVNPARVAAMLPALVPALDRRKYSAGHTPERRRVARLNSDELASTAANH
jgi:hypothetical protein